MGVSAVKLLFVKLESGNLDDQENERGAKHDLGVACNVLAVGDTTAEKTFLRSIGLVVHNPFSTRFFKRPSTKSDGNEPWECEQHHRASGKHTHTGAHRILSIIAQPRRQSHHSVGHSSKNGQYNAAHQPCH